MGDEIGQLNEAPLIEEKQESSMRLPSPPAASSASQVPWAFYRAVPRPPGRSVRAQCTFCVLERVPLHRGRGVRVSEYVMKRL